MMIGFWNKHTGNDEEIACAKCGKNIATIMYDFECCDHGHQPLCGPCAEHIALGMLRDVAELKVGQKKSDEEYHKLMEKYRGIQPPHDRYAAF